MVHLSLRNMEGKMALKRNNVSTSSTTTESGQAAVLFAIVLALMAIFTIGLLEYMTTNAQVQEAVAIADLAAHAGAQEIAVYPNGVIYSTGNGEQIAAAYFHMQAPSHIHFGGVSCGLFQGRPGCRVTAMVQSTGYLLPSQWITVRAIGYMANGVTRGDQ